MFGLSFNPFLSKTFWGAVALAAAAILTAYGTDAGITREVIAQAIGILLAGIGLRDAVAAK